MIAASDKLSKDDIKAKLFIVPSWILSHRTLDLDLHFCENRSHIQGITLLGPHTKEIAHDPDLTVPGAFNWL